MTIKPPLPSSTLIHARNLRERMTDAERKVWTALRALKAVGFKFRRQHPIPPYVADFCCVSGRLVVELDGAQHSSDADISRTRYLEAQGWQVLRFWDHDALTSTEAVIDAICRCLAEPYPHPNPSPGGRGA